MLDVFLIFPIILLEKYPLCNINIFDFSLYLDNAIHLLKIFSKYIILRKLIQKLVEIKNIHAFIGAKRTYFCITSFLSSLKNQSLTR